MDALATGHVVAAQMINTCTNLFRADGQFRHSRHAQIARRVNPSHAGGIAEDHKSASHFPRPPHQEGRLAIVTKRGAGCDGRWLTLKTRAWSCGR